MRIAELKKIGYLHISQFAFRLSPFAFRNFSIGGCPKSGQARGPAPTGEKMAKEIEMKAFVYNLMLGLGEAQGSFTVSS
jgi:hypothetical protein